VVFRRDNKVDSFQRQMSALRNQLGSTGDELEDTQDDMPELDDDQFASDNAYRNQAGAEQDAGAYSFGAYPAQAGQGVSAMADELPPAIPEIPAADGLMSVVARETTLKGDINSEHSIHVYGKVEGTLTASEDVWVAEGAEVEATITAQRVLVAGVLGGSVIASARFEALPTGQVTADISSPITVVHEGASINGNFKVGSGEVNSDSRSERASAASVIQRRSRTAS
jgi:cytoskeletal protein CcmA (bactofilin family)